ncbi:LysR family transcriptional regulator [Aeromonas jandaei]|uniref:LysR family transcriptional regulator n=1 Tax=Aeromonas jandaei TaxID=650 RepID=UPI003B9DE64C
MLKPLKINELKSIACIAQVDKISTAAALLGTSQANLSRLLSTVETQIGLKIFDRSTRHLSLSDFGKALLPRIHHLLQANEDVCNFIDTYKENPTGNVTIAAPLGALIFITRHIIPEIAMLHPEISISLVSYILQVDARDLSMESDWDLMFSVSMPRDENLISRQAGKFSMGLYATPEFIKSNPILSVSDLASSNACILLRTLGETYNTWQYKDQHSAEIKNLIVHGKYVCDQSSYAIELARQNLGFVYAPQFLVTEDIESGRLVSCLSDEFHMEYDAYLLYRNRKFQPHRVNVIIDTIVAKLNEIN